MLILLSPSKTLDLDTPIKTGVFSEPKLLKHSEELVKKFKKYSVKDIEKLMKVSTKIATLNRQRFNEFTTPFTTKNSRQALFTFVGDVYRDIKVHDYSAKELAFAQKHVRTLSGLYGVLKPLDLMQAYRLEMHLETNYWKEKITNYLQEDLKEHKFDTILDLASKEYSKVVQCKNLNATTYTVNFKENKNGEYKIVAIYTKLARGTMTNHIIKNGITSPEQIKNFKEDGYKFSAKLSTVNDFTFTRG